MITPKKILMRELTWDEIHSLPDEYLVKYYKFHHERNSNHEDGGHGVGLYNLMTELHCRGYETLIDIKFVVTVKKTHKSIYESDK